jgi:V-type H+-transporting ATPase subunit E
MRLKVLTAREEALRAVLADAGVRVAAFASPASPAYKALLGDLVAQGVAKMGRADGALKVRCRQVDLSAVTDAVAKVAKAHPNVPLSVDTTAFLPPPPDAARPDAACCHGGVVIATADGSVKVSNTLEDRLKISYELNVPQMRINVFGKSGGHLRVK